MSSTQNENPIATLIEDLGIEEPATLDADSKEDLNLNDSEENNADSTLTDENVNTENSDETPDEGDTETKDGDDILAKITALEEKQAMAEKRLADKDKYINELKNKLENNTKEETVATEEVSQEEKLEFWDDPEQYIAKLREEMKAELTQSMELSRMANVRVDESYYAKDKDDYLELVNPDKITAEFQVNPEFEKEFRESSRPYEVAYKYMKAKQSENKTSEEELEAKILAKHGYSIKKSKSTPPSINNLGNSSSKSNGASVDGFASVFGSSY